MKRCPTCQLTYTDPTLRFCLEDGTALIDAPTSGDETVVMDPATGSDEPPPTEILPFGPPPTVRAYDDEATAQRNKLAATARQQARQTLNEFQNGAAVAAVPEARKTTSVVAITVIATVLVLAVGGLGVWLVMREKSADGPNTKTENTGRNTDSNGTNSNGQGTTGTNTNATPGVVITPSPTVTPMGTPSPTPTRPPDNSTARSEVLAALNGWTETMKRADLNGHMAYYATVLHTYYNASNYGVAGVRANVARAFAKYTSFDVRLTNIQVEVDPSGNKAVATFTKSFVFSGNGNYQGSGLNRFWFEKIGGRWLITGEKDYGK